MSGKDGKTGKWLLVLTWILAVSLGIFQVYTNGIRLLGADYQRAIHLGLGLALVFLFYQTKSRLKWFRILDLILMTLALGVMVYRVYDVRSLLFRIGSPTTLDMIMGLILVVLVLEASRRTTGWALPLIAISTLIYARFGDYFPGFMKHQGLDWEWILSHLYLSTEGIYGIAIQVSAAFIYLFLLFGAVLVITGGGEFFINIASALAGTVRGGPAKIAIFSSALFGTISGSAAANVAGTGTFTIPMMKKIGYPPHIAGAVEAVASSGGMLMPPVMGAAAFIMADMLRMPYASICVAAILPALVYYFALFCMVDFYAGKEGLKGLPRDEIPKIGPLIRQGWIYFFPIIALIYLLFALRATPGKAAFWAMVLMVVVYIAAEMVRKKGGAIKQVAIQLAPTFFKAGKDAAPVISTCAVAGILIGIFSLTGLTMKLSGILVSLAGGSLPVLLVLTMLCSFLLGMGLPTVACYIIQSVLIAPALIEMGVLPIAAHMFIFYFGILANVTPPVAVAAYVAAGIAGSNPVPTGFKAFQLGIAGFLLPYSFVYNPALLLQGSPLLAAQGFLTALAGAVCLSGTVSGWLYRWPCTWVERILLGFAGVCLIDPGWVTDIIGTCIMIVIIGLKVLSTRTASRAAAKVEEVYPPP